MVDVNHCGCCRYVIHSLLVGIYWMLLGVLWTHMGTRGDRQVTVRGQRWRLRFVPNLGDKFGECDYGQRVIRIAQGQSEEEELDTLIHELLHAAYPDLEESAIHQTAEAVAGVLWRLGWRKPNV